MNTEQKQVIRMDNEAFFAIVKERLDTGDVVKIPVVGKSMEPFLREKDEVEIYRSKHRKVAVGDIVLAKWGERYVLHRVVRRKGKELWLAGDNNLVQIEKVNEADLLGALLTAKRDEKLLPVWHTRNKYLGLLWYYLRFPRRVVAVIRRS